MLSAMHFFLHRLEMRRGFHVLELAGDFPQPSSIPLTVFAFRLSDSWNVDCLGKDMTHVLFDFQILVDLNFEMQAFEVLAT